MSIDITALLSIVLQWGLHRGPHTPMGPHWDGGAMAPWGGTSGTAIGVAWPVFILFLLALAILLAVNLVQTRSSDTNRAMTVLREAYARAEFDDEEFERVATRLTGSTNAETGDPD